jgi:ribosomal protein S18 acetylase RimI-like enzyme
MTDTVGLTHAVRKARAEDVPRFAATLARAFDDDPPVQWVMPDAATRVPRLEQAFALYLRRLWIEQDVCFMTDDGAGAAAWELPGRWKVPVSGQLRLLAPMLRIYRRETPRVLKALAALESGHPEAPHYYLPFAGVLPERQGQGIGTALLRPVLDRCDAERVAAYLEATTPRNRELYARNGFEVTEEFTLGDGSPPLWRMWRAPRG